MILTITKYGQAVLRQQSQPVTEVTDEIRTLVSNMLETMYAAKGVGLAAEQVGRTERICVIDIPKDAEKAPYRETNAGVKMPMVLINPEIIAKEGRQRNEEGCLSFPDIGVPITRENQVTVRYQDLDGNERTDTVYGLLARAVQHETDHLDGVLLVDRMSSLQKMSIAGQLRRLQQAFGA